MRSHRDERPVPPQPRFRKQRAAGEQPAGTVLFVIAVALLVGAVLAGDRLGSSARSLELGAVRSVAVAVATPFEFVARGLGLDRIRSGIRAALDDMSQPRAAGAPAEPGAPMASQPDGERADGPEQSTSVGAVPDVEPQAPAFRNPTPSASNPLTFLTVGDSMTESFGKYLKSDLVETGVVKASHDFKYSSGLARPDFFDWPAHLEDTIPSANPDCVLIMIGANDGQNMTIDGKPVQFGSDQWKAEYARRVARTMDILSADGRRVYWVGLPIARSETYAKKVKVRNKIYRAEAERHENVLYVDTWSLFAAADGTYTAYLRDRNGDKKLMRNEDGIHLSVSGAHHLADYIMDIVSSDYTTIN